MKPSRNVMLVFFTLALFESCDEDLSNPLIGSWLLKGTIIQNCKDKSQNIANTYFCDESACRKYNFSPDGTLTVDIHEGETLMTISGRYVISGSTAVITIDTKPHSISSETFKVTVSGSTLYLKEIITDLSGKCNATIVLGR